ncbi:hypothetical protein AAG906_025557 [Vitis piasezkii]
MQVPPVSGREAHQGRTFKAIPPLRCWGPPAAPKAVINYINGGPSDEEYDSKRKRQKLLRAASVRERINSIRPGLTGGGPRPIDETIIFPPVDPTWTLLTISRRPHPVPRDRRLDSHRPRKPWTNPVRIQRVVNHVLGRHCTVGPSRPSHSQRAILVVQDLSPFNSSSTYHQMVSFLTKDGQIDLYGNQLVVHQCYRDSEKGTVRECIPPRVQPCA